MDGATPPNDPERLLANSAWLHALARSLVADDHRADDVVQQTFAAAIEHPPGDGVPLRPWLARVARNFSLKALRSEGRRADREARAPAPPPTASPAESVARAETFRDVVDAVLALEPIYRDVVIARFFDGLDAHAVATRLGVPDETARTRLKRALAMLRDRLDRQHGDRRAWAVLLVGRSAVPTATGGGAAVVAMKVAAVAAVAAIAFLGGRSALRTGGAPRSVPRHDVSTAAVASPAAPVARRPAARSRVAVPPADAAVVTGVRPKTGGTLVVRVTEAGTRRPIAGATVMLRNRQTLKTTDAAGLARFEERVTQDWLVTADAPGHLGETASAAIDSTSLDLVLRPAATIDVRTVDASGAPLPDVGFHWQVLGTEGLGTYATDGDGRALLPALPNVVMAVRVAANSSHHARTSAAVWTGPLGAPPVTVTLRVVPEARLVGVVRDPGGNPADGAIVRAMPSEAQPADFDRARGGLEGSADESGAYVVGGLVRGRRYDVVALDWRFHGGGFAPSAPAKGVCIADGDAETTRDFALRGSTKLVVRVTGPNGEPMPDASASLMRADSFVTSQAQTPGVFVWESLLPGRFLLEAEATGVSPVGRVVDVLAGETNEVSVQLGRPQPSIAGTVVDETGAPVTAAEVRVLVAAAFTHYAVTSIATTDETGRFRGDVPGDGALALDVAAPGHVPLRAFELPGPSEDVRLVLRRAATVTFDPTADPDAPAVRTIRLLFGGGAHVDTVYTDNSGRVRIEKEPCGETEMRLYVERFAPVVRRVKLDAGGVDDLGEIRLVAPAPLRGRVVDADGRAVGNASVCLDMGDDDLKLRPVRTDADGAFTSPLAPPSGAVPLRVEAPGFLTLRASVAVDGDAPVTLRLARGGAVWGEVVDASGAPVPGAKVSITDAEGAKTTADADDCGLFGARVRTGRAAVSCGAAAATADVEDGGESHVRLVLPSR